MNGWIDSILGISFLPYILMLSLLFLLQSLKAIGYLLFILSVVSTKINCHQYLLKGMLVGNKMFEWNNRSLFFFTVPVLMAPRFDCVVEGVKKRFKICQDLIDVRRVKKGYHLCCQEASFCGR